MRRLKTFVQLPRNEQTLLLRTALTVGTIRVALWVLPFSFVRRESIRRGTLQTGGAPQASYGIERIVWAVRAVSRCIPGATCLTQAMAAQHLLGRCGHRSTVQIGVANDDRRGFEAHAWLVHGEQILLGGATADRFVALTAWEA